MDDEIPEFGIETLPSLWWRHFGYRHKLYTRAEFEKLMKEKAKAVRIQYV